MHRKIGMYNFKVPENGSNEYMLNSYLVLLLNTLKQLGYEKTIFKKNKYA